MTATRSIQLDFGVPDQTADIQLGALTQRRGIKEIDNVLYPRFTGFHVENPLLDVTIVPGQGNNNLLRPNQAGGNSFISEDVTINGNIYVLPYVGTYRIRCQLAYENPNAPGSMNIRINVSCDLDSPGSTQIVSAREIGREINGIASLDRVVVCSRITSISAVVDGDIPIRVLSSFNDVSPIGNRAADTFIDVEYIGTSPL